MRNLSNRPGYREEDAEINLLARDLGIFAQKHRLIGCVLLSFEGERVGVNTNGATAEFAGAMDRLGSMILASFDDGNFDGAIMKETLR